MCLVKSWRFSFPNFVCHALRREPQSPGSRRVQPAYLGTLGGALAGRDGTCGGAPNASLPLGNGGNGPGRKGTGGAPAWGPGEGAAGAGPRPGVGRGGTVLRVGLRCVVGLGGGDLVARPKQFAHCCSI